MHTASRITFEQGRATGITCSVNGQGHHFVASREVILSSGAISSPQLLMLRDWPGRCLLSEAPVDVVLDAPAWAPICRHLDVTACQHCQQADRLTISEVKAALHYFTPGGHQAGTSNVAEGAGFFRSSLASDERCDIQLHFIRR
ncbi:MAG: GMC family oxidoreductase N-terminal domain-containing protein [Lysobacterales bacterium]